MKICLVCEGISATEQPQCSSCGFELVEISSVHFPIRRGEEDAAHPLLDSLIGGKYRITNVLGKGGMGTVFRAIHEVSLVPIALKILHPRFAEQESYRRSFLAEARKAGSVIHEHSARILDVGEQADGTAYIAMELVHGVTLDEWFGAGKSLTAANVVDILQQVCEALAVARQVGVVHRDLSPRNVMAQVREGRPWIKILDFGIAKAAPTVASDVLPPGAFASPPYSAPEHLAGRDVDMRADLYSLGVLAFRALSGVLPVTGTDREAWIRATIEGDLRPLRAPSGTPPKLVRLIERLLAVDPDERPPTPNAVIAELAQIRRPRGQWLRTVALGLLVSSTAGFLFAHADGGGQPFLRLRPGAAFTLSPSEPSADAPPDQLRSDQLARLSFLHGGFDGRRLEVTAYHGQVPVQAREIEPQVLAGGELSLSTEASPGYAAFLRTLATFRDPVVLVFGVPGRAPLGYAKVLVDDEAPAVRLRVTVAQAGILAAESRLTMMAEDRGTVRELELTVSLRSGKDVIRLPLPARPQQSYTARELLGARFPGVAERPNVELSLRAIDGAGNETRRPATESFAFMDLAASRIERIGGVRDRRLVAFDRRGAELILHTDGVEPNLELTVRAPDGVEQTLPFTVRNAELSIVLPRRDDGAVPFVPGVYVFRLRDPAGNVSEFTTGELVFRSSDVEAQVFVERSTGAAVAVEQRVVSDGAPMRLRLRCNTLYRPSHAALSRRSGEGVAPQSASLADAQLGEATIEIGALSDGSYVLRVDLSDPDGVRRATAESEIVVLGTPVELRLPVLSDARFLKQLVDADLFREEDGRLRQGRAWSLVPGDTSLLRGHLWVGRPGALTPVPLQSKAGASWFDEILPVRGENIVALEAKDVLDRPVRVMIGGREAPVLEQADGSALREVARFHHWDDERILGSVDARVEYGQPVRLEVRSRFPFQSSDAVQLEVGGARVGATAVHSDYAGASMLFEVPFELVAAAAGLGKLAPEDFAKDRDVNVAALLRSPAGADPVTVRLRTTLSTLLPVRLAVLAHPDAPLPPALAAIRMLPEVGPGLGRSVSDPVGDDVARRITFRPFPGFDVRNVTQYFLQRSEMTRDQYAQACAAFAALPAQRRPPWQELVHAADPLGERRLQTLVPHASRDEAAFRAMVRSAPRRPVTGVDFFQAYAVTRIVGLLVAGDPDLLRLPMGVELEIAALGFGARRVRGALNGVSVTEPLRILDGHRTFGVRMADPARWPPTADESAAAGDATRGVLGFELIGADFGVREWVFDLPYVGSGQSATLLEEWLRDHVVHLARARSLARGEGGQPFGDLAPLLGQRGVARGLALGELRGLFDAAAGVAVDPLRARRLPLGVPGVVRTLILRRDGSGLVGEHDPHLGRIGFRLAGGSEFVEEARRR